MFAPGSEILLETELRQLDCHHTWDLKKEDTDLNFLEVKFSENLQSSQDYIGNLAKYGLNFLAYVKFLQGDSTASLEHLKLALQKQSCCAEQCAVTYASLAWVHHHMGDAAGAKSFLQKIQETCGTTAMSSAAPPPPLPLPRQVLSEKAWALLSFSKKPHYYTRAKDIFQEALEKEPHDREWNTGYAFALFRLEGLETREDKRLPVVVSPAAQQLKKAMTLDPSNPMIHVYLGLKCYRNGRNAEAWVHMRRAVAMAADDLAVVLQVAKFMKKEQSHDMALHTLLRILQRAPNSSRLHHQIGSIYRWKAIAMEQPHHPRLLQRCIFHFEEGARLNPAFIYPQVELALRYAELKNVGEAERRFQKLFSLPELRPVDLQACHRMYGDFHLHQLGAVGTAVEHYKQGMRLRNISTEWSRCRSRLLKIMQSRQDDHHIGEFIDSFRTAGERDHRHEADSDAH